LDKKEMKISELIEDLIALRHEHGDIEVWAVHGFTPELVIHAITTAPEGQLKNLKELCPRDYEYPQRVILELKAPEPSQ
jgi:hypothetical protein